MNSLLFINKRLICIEFLARLTLSIIFFKSCFFNINNIFNKFDMLSVNNINCVFLSRYQTGLVKEYIYPGSGIEVLTSFDSQTPVRSEIFMQTKLRNGFEDIVLNENEAAISGNISSLINRKAGDFLYIDAGYKKIDKYVISHVFEPSYGTFYEPLSNRGLILLGYDRNYENNIKTKYISFSYDPLTDLDPIVINSIDNTRDIIVINDFKLKMFIVILRELSLFTFLAFCVFLLIRNTFGSYWSRYFVYLSQLGYSGKFVVSVILFFSALLIFLPFLSGFLINILINNSINLNLKTFYLMSFIFVFLSLAWCLYCNIICIINKRFKHG